MTLAALQALEGGRRPGARRDPRPTRPSPTAPPSPPPCRSAVRHRRGRRRHRRSWASRPTGPRPATTASRRRRRRRPARRGRSSRNPTLDRPRSATCAEGGYHWNSGMFVLRAFGLAGRAAARFRPDIAAGHPRRLGRRGRRRAFLRPGKAEFAAVPSESVDYAVMEKLPRQRDRDIAHGAAGRRLERPGRVGRRSGRSRGKDSRATPAAATRCSRDSRNTLVHATSRLVSVVGLDDVVVVETPDAVLVSRPQPQPGRQEDRRRARPPRGAASTTLHRKVHRPWGWYDSIDAGDRASRSSASWSSPAPR